MGKFSGHGVLLVGLAQCQHVRAAGVGKGHPVGLNISWGDEEGCRPGMGGWNVG